MSLRRWILVLVAAALVVVAFASTYTVQEYEQVVMTRFGKIRDGAIDAPGLHLKAPFIDRIRRFDRRWLAWDGDPNQIPTRDKKYIWVDAYARWRIEDPVLFYKRLRDERGAQSRLDDIIDGEIRNAIANHNLIELVRTSSRPFARDIEPREGEDAEGFAVELGREALRRVVLGKASAVMPDYGIELADVRIKRINYVESVQRKVFERMISERKRIAEQYRSEGQGRSAEIRGLTEKELRTIRSEAYRRAQEIEGEGDAEAARIYADAYGTDPELYEFLKTLETYGETIDAQTLVVLSTDAQLLRYLEDDQPASP